MHRLTLRKLQWASIALILLIVAALFALRMAPWKTQTSDEEYLKLFRDTLSIVQKSYVEKVEGKKLVQGAVTGMLQSLDPHSNFMPAESFREMKISTRGSFGGIGIEITLQEGRLTVISPIEDTPASRIGLRPGDVIARIDTSSTRNMTINEAVQRMRGEPGTRVTLTVVRKGSEAPLVFPVVRDIIKVKSLRAQMLENGIGHLRILQFQERTGPDFAAALEKLRKENGGELKGLILDLRNNPGGLLDQAVDVANHFIGGKPGKDLIVYTRGRQPESRADFYATIGEKEPPYPMVVLINGGSASASEIIAGALQDHRRAVIMGTQSFGKGSVQSMIPVRDGGGILLTTARYYTPSGRSIQAKGITPDIVVENLRLGGSAAAGKNSLSEKDLANHLAGDRREETGKVPAMHPPRKEVSSGEDYQVKRALELLEGWDTLRSRRLPGTEEKS